jgi:cyclohexa-1,5-dienecarbonyl-CoA hydratase
MDAQFQFLRLEETGGIARLTLDRPPLNILTIEMIAEVEEALARVERMGDVHALVLAGAGKAFCAGVDVAEHTSELVEPMIRRFGALFRRLRALALPTLAVVHGAALGGGTELALGCDLIVAGASARFGQPEIKLGVFPPIAAAILPGMMGRQHAARIILTGETLSADEAARIGLISAAAPDSQLTATVEQLLGQWRALSPASLRLAKCAFLLGEQSGLAGLDAIETLYLRDLMATADACEGIAAFMQKRQPVWQGR